MDNLVTGAQNVCFSAFGTVGRWLSYYLLGFTVCPNLKLIGVYTRLHLATAVLVYCSGSRFVIDAVIAAAAGRGSRTHLNVN